jgi:hypothetical protein
VLRLRSADALRLHEETDKLAQSGSEGLPPGPGTAFALVRRVHSSGGKRTVRRAGAGGTLTRGRQKLLSFLDKHADIKLRVALRYTIEHLDKGLRSH